MEKIENIFITPDSLNEKGESEILFKLEKIDRTSTVYVYINSGGGDLYSAFSIIDSIKFFSKKSIGIVIGRCYSAAVDILLSLDRRFCTPSSSLMIHESSLSFGDSYEFTSRLNDDIVLQKKVEDERIKTVLKKTLIDKETLMSYIEKKKDMYFSASESVEWGLVESIVKNEKDLTTKLKSTKI
jgi:ATP-dependent Clp protease protease subunit